MNTSSYLPKQKMPVVALLVVAFLVVVGVLYWKSNPSLPTHKNLAEESGITLHSDEQKTALERDVDEDGIVDWEEMLWGTDIQNADSDGDGTTDGDEVKQNRDPNIPGPNDRLESEEATDPNDITTATERKMALDPSEEASRNFFARVLALQKAGVLNENSGKELASLYAGDVLENKDAASFFKIYQESDLSVTGASTETTLREYANKMGTILQNTPSVEGAPNELPLFQQALATKNPEDFKKIQPFSDRYHFVVEKSLAVPVPNEAVQIHLGFINGMSALETQSGAMARFYEEPVRSVLILKEYIQNREPVVLSAFLAVHAFFEQKNISFSRNEPGFIYTNFSLPTQS